MFVHSKSNLAPNGTPQAFGFDDSVLTWLGEYEITLDELLDGKKKEPKTDTQKDAAMSFLQTALADGDVLSTEIMREANARGITEITLRRAKKAIGVRSYQSSGVWFCSLAGMENTVGISRTSMLEVSEVYMSDAYVGAMSA